MSKCVVCAARPDAGQGFCLVCARAYDRNALLEGTINEVIRWAAHRARRFERKRARKAQRGKVTP